MAKMMDTTGFSIKHLQVAKANRTILIAISATAAVVVFSLVATASLIQQVKYQNKVIGLRKAANSQLQKNIQARDGLVTSYEAFDNSTESIIGNSDKNSKIVLDALPSKYDFPALTISLENLITSSGAKVESITGTDNEAEALQESANPNPVDIPFSISANGSKENVQKLIENLQKSIRPINVSTISLTAGNENNVTVSIDAKTYYQPSRKLEIKRSVVSANGKSTKSSTSSTAKTTQTTNSGATN